MGARARRRAGVGVPRHPLRGAAAAGAVVIARRSPVRARGHRGAAPVAGERLRRHRAVARRRGAAGLDARPHRVPGAVPGAGARHPAHGPSPRRRRGLAAVRLRPPRPVGRPGVRRHRLPPAVLALGRDRRQHVRGHAVPGGHRRGGAAVGGPPLRGRRRHARGRPVDHVPPRHPADGGAVDHGGRRAVLGPRPRGVRGDGHLRGQPAGPHADHAAGGVPCPRVRPGGRDRPVARAGGGVPGGAGAAAGPLVAS